MGSWAASFVLVGLVLAPLVVKAAGVTVSIVPPFHGNRCACCTWSISQSPPLELQLPDAEEIVLLQNYSTLTATDKSFLVLANQVRVQSGSCTYKPGI